MKMDMLNFPEGLFYNGEFIVVLVEMLILILDFQINA